MQFADTNCAQYIWFGKNCTSIYYHTLENNHELELQEINSEIWRKKTLEEIKTHNKTQQQQS
jgi:hypothetical protein